MSVMKILAGQVRSTCRRHCVEKFGKAMAVDAAAAAAAAVANPISFPTAVQRGRQVSLCGALDKAKKSQALIALLIKARSAGTRLLCRMVRSQLDGSCAELLHDHFPACDSTLLFLKQKNSFAFG